MKVYQALAQAFERTSDGKWTDITGGRIYNIMKGAPSGPGIESGTSFIPGECNREKLVFFTEYHHRTKDGYYDGRTYHQVIVTHDLLGLNIRVTGRNKNDIRNHLSDVYYQWLMQDVDWITGKYID